MSSPELPAPNQKTIAEHFEDFKEAEAYNYPRSDYSGENFARYLNGKLGELLAGSTVEVQDVQD